MGKRIVMAVTNDLLTDQRVHRACGALTEAGYEVCVVGRRMEDSVPLCRPYATRRMKLFFRKKVWFYAEYNVRLLLRLLFSRADLFYANDTDTLPAVVSAAWLRGKKSFFDAHEMFPEVPELQGRQRVKRCWQTVERLLVPKVSGGATVCESVADYYRRYGVEMKVVRNVPVARYMTENIGREQGLIVYQGALNVGRCIDRAIDAMCYMPDCKLVIAGHGDEAERLRQYVATLAWKERIAFVGRMAPDDLARLTARASLGLCLLENRGLNYYYSLPNRLGDYVWAEVPVIASDFPEIGKVVRRYGIGTLVDETTLDKGNGKALADKMRSTIEAWSHITEAERRQKFAVAKEDMCWDREKNVLVGAINTILRQS